MDALTPTQIQVQVRSQLGAADIQEQLGVVLTRIERATDLKELLDARDDALIIWGTACTVNSLHAAKNATERAKQEMRRLQGDAVMVIASAHRRLADEYDAAQQRGEVKTVGQPRKSNIPNENNTPTVIDIGLTSKDIFNARAIRDAEKNEPGFIKNSVDEMVANGEAPTARKLLVAAVKLVAEAKKAQAAEAKPPAPVGNTRILSRGNKVSVPDGHSSLLSAARAGLQIEIAGGDREKALAASKLAKQTYNILRDLLLLLERNDLGKADRVTVERARDRIEKTHRVQKAAMMIKPVSNKVWGVKGHRHKSDKKRSEAFSGSISFVLTTCTATADIEVPNLSTDQKQEAMTAVREAIAALKELFHRIRRH